MPDTMTRRHNDTSVASEMIALPGSSITARWVVVDPEMAEEILKNQADNRHADEKMAQRYAGDMNRGDWFPYGSLAFNTDGELIDGQHRLRGIIKSGTSQWFLFVEGLEQAVQNVMDQGKKRTFGDQLHIIGVKNSNAIATMIRMIWNYEVSGVLPSANAKGKPTLAQLMRLYEEKPEMIAFYNTKKVEGLSSSLLSAFTYLASLASDGEEDALRFREFITLPNLEDLMSAPGGKVLLLLRERLRKEMMGSDPFNEKIRSVFLIRTYNAWRLGEDLKQLKFKAGGANPEIAPRIHGCPIVPGERGLTD